MADTGKLNWFSRTWSWIDFWSKLPPAQLVDDPGKQRIQADLKSLRAETRELLTGIWIRQNDQLARDLESIRTRGAGLLAATGVITGVLTLLVPVGALLHSSVSLNSATADVLLALVAIAFVGMIFCALATVVLAIRAQEVDFWGQSEIHPAHAKSTVAYKLELAFSQYVTYTDNVSRLRNPAGYLRQAQFYFRLLVFALATLVVVSVLASFAGAFVASGAAVACATPSPSNSATGVSPHCP